MRKKNRPLRSHKTRAPALRGERFTREGTGRSAEIPQVRTYSRSFLSLTTNPICCGSCRNSSFESNSTRQTVRTTSELHAAMDGRGFKSTIVLEDDSVCM